MSVQSGRSDRSDSHLYNYSQHTFSETGDSAKTTSIKSGYTDSSTNYNFSFKFTKPSEWVAQQRIEREKEKALNSLHSKENSSNTSISSQSSLSTEPSKKELTRQQRTVLKRNQKIQAFKQQKAKKPLKSLVQNQTFKSIDSSSKVESHLPVQVSRLAVDEKVSRLALSQLLHLTEDQIDELELTQLSPPEIEEVLTQYAHILDKYNPVNETLVTKDGALKTNLNRTTLLKILKAAVLSPLPLERLDLKEHSITWLKSDQKLSIFALASIRELGEGGFGQVLGVFDYVKGEEVAVKIARSNYDSYADLKNEVKMLELIHDPYLPTPPGIVKPCHQFIDIQGLRRAIVMDKYESSLIDYFNTDEFKSFSFEEKIDLALQLLRGLEHLNLVGVAHGDIKSDNIFVKNKQAFIADFGGAQDMHNPNIQEAIKEGERPIETLSLTHTAYTDEAFIKEAIQNKDYTQWIKINQSKNLFALGIVIFQMFAINNDYPYRISAMMNLPLINEGIRLELLPPNIPDEMANLLSAILSPAFKDRPQLDEVIAKFEQFKPKSDQLI